MKQPLRFSSAASLIVLGSLMAGCAAHQSRVDAESYLRGKADVDTGLATRALAALNSNQIPLAINLAERAVEKTPKDAGFRALLGNAYFAGGRFHSAEQAYRDALTLYPDQPQVVLKLALVQIAQGRTSQAIAVLNSARSVLNASDYGLALALAGHPSEAIAVLDRAARDANADATVRQNLALAHALAGDWTEARTIAAQDVPANLLDARMHQWMELATPKHPSDQVAALVGVTPASVDSGQPVQLALNKDDNNPVPAIAPEPQKVAETAPVRLSPAAPAFIRVADFGAAPEVAVAPAPPPPRSTLASLAATAVADVSTALASVMPHHSVRAARPAKLRVAATVRPTIGSGKSNAVVQLGAYESASRVLAAWNVEARKYGALKTYSPMSARFASPKGTFYRLSVRGFDSLGQADALCRTLHRQGASCFVRNFAGDAPINIASR